MDKKLKKLADGIKEREDLINKKAPLIAAQDIPKQKLLKSVLDNLGEIKGDEDKAKKTKNKLAGDIDNFKKKFDAVDPENAKIPQLAKLEAEINGIAEEAKDNN